MAHLLPLENLQLDLKAVKMTGISGWPRVGAELAKLWAYDLSRHQVHRLLTAVQPIRSVANVGSGVADLVLLPVSHYKQHGNLRRGVQRGLASFLRSVSAESMSAAARLAQGAQTVLEHVDDVVSFAPAPLPPHAQNQFAASQRARRRAGSGGGGASAAVSSSSASSSSSPLHPDSLHLRRRSHVSKQANAPPSASEGFRQAYESLSRGLQSAATQLVVVPRDEYARYGGKGAIKSAVRAMPSALLHPAIAGMEAVSKVFNGITNSIEPRRKRENANKFKNTTSK